MLRIVVFDGGWGGNVVASYLQKELQVAEIIKVIDWRHAPYEDHDIGEIRQFAEECLLDYFNKVDLIVLAGYSASLAKGYLRRRYPEQKFASVGINYYQVLHARVYPSSITLLMNGRLMDTPWNEEICQHLPYSTLVIPDCSGWEELANNGELSREIIEYDLAPYFELSGTKPKSDAKLIDSDVVLLLNTHLWDLKEEIEQVFGYKARVLDFRRKLVHDVCVALGLLGADGRRSK